ncbi:putative cytochrome P450 E-class, group IV [Cladorrhinum samala]|uniref:Cytochrome P450 E-class, group IV n=1 Tax=Cladorrhinum samala TaxID=585594 RepID=A0AAV9HXZ8_9PEZI|nr:putative cytochrome P450 E-class, group IV [Cladorrhinum samala]
MALTEAISQVFGTKLPLVLSTVAVLGAVILFQIFVNGNPLANIPVVGEELGSDEKRRQAYLFKAKDVYIDGYKKVRRLWNPKRRQKHDVFRIVTSNKFTVVVVPAKYLTELRNLPDDTVSFEGAIEQTMHAKYTQLEFRHKLIVYVIKTNLTPALNRLNPSIAEEVQESFRKELPPCPDWTPININQKLLRIVALVSGRIFLGTKVARSEAYVDAAINYTIELMRARHAVEAVRPWLRPFKAPHLPEIKALRARLRAGEELLRPLLAERRNLSDTEEKPEDMLQWILDGQSKYRPYSTEELARVQLTLSFAAIHTTTMTATNTLYNLAVYPEYIPILREEISSVLSTTGGVFTSQALQNMKRLDSFIKESMRIDPPGATSFNRKVLKSFALSSGQVIPAGVIIEVPAEALTRDPEIFPNPDTFQPWRFYDLRSELRNEGEADKAAQHQFASIGQTVLTFGYGRHACPGRFFAANEIKMIVANILMQYDVKMPEGMEGKRYPNIRYGGTNSPDPTKELLFKKIVKA